MLGFILLICPEATHGRISTKFCTAAEVVDVITRDNFFGDRLRDVDSVGIKNGVFSYTKPLAVNSADATAQRVTTRVSWRERK